MLFWQQIDQSLAFDDQLDGFNVNFKTIFGIDQFMNVVITSLDSHSEKEFDDECSPSIRKDVLNVDDRSTSDQKSAKKEV